MLNTLRKVEEHDWSQHGERRKYARMFNNTKNEHRVQYYLFKTFNIPTDDYLTLIRYNGELPLLKTTVISYTCLAYMKLYLVIIGPISHDKLTKYKIRSSYYLLQFGSIYSYWPKNTIVVTYIYHYLPTCIFCLM